MLKIELASALAEALNLLNDLQAGQQVDGLSQRQANQLNGILARLPAAVRADFANNGTIRHEELLSGICYGS